MEEKLVEEKLVEEKLVEEKLVEEKLVEEKLVNGFLEFIKIATVGPRHLRLNEDVLRLIGAFMQETKIILICKYCGCELLTEKNNKMFMQIEYFTDNSSDTHFCYDCSKFRNVKRFFGAEHLDSDALTDAPWP
jgi:hypothetical protein